MNAPEEIGKVATNAIDALKAQPALLVLVFLQVLTLGTVYFVSQANNVRSQDREMAILNRCFPPSHRTD